MRWVTAATVLVLGLLALACDDATSDPPDPTATVAADDAVDELGLPVYPAAPPVTPADTTTGVAELQWWGQSLFILMSPRGGQIAMDPYGDIGYRVHAGFVGIVTVSHDHPDHNNVELLGHNILLRGLTDEGWAQIDERPTGGVRIRTVPSWHDESRGAERGRNAIFVFETGGMRIVHLGDLGHALTQAQIDAIGPVDLLLVPVGGFFTIDAAGATAVVEQLAPRVVIPMHYKTDSVTIPQLAPVDAFLEGKEVVEMSSNSTSSLGTPRAVDLLAEDLPSRGSAVVWLLQPVGAQ